MKTGKVLLLGCGILLAVLLLLGVVGGGFFYYISKDPDGLAAYVESPDKVERDELFDLKVIVVNERKTRSLEVSSIDLGDDYLAGFTVRGAEPATKSSMHIPLAGGQSFEFNRVIRAGATNVFTFHMRAAKAGLHRGDVDVCEGMRYLTVMAQTEVK